MTGGRHRTVLAKVGLDGHDVGINLIARALVNGGFEVVYLGKRVPPDSIVASAIAEDAAVIGISSLSGGLGHFAVGVLDRLRSQQAQIPVIAGGIDEPAEIDRMLRKGVFRYFGPGSAAADVVSAFVDASRAATADGGLDGPPDGRPQ